MAATHPANFKQEAHKLVDQLPDDATWQDLIYSAAVRRSVEQGLKESEAGQTVSHEDVLKEFGLAE
jgi:hypothetical protein